MAESFFDHGLSRFSMRVAQVSGSLAVAGLLIGKNKPLAGMALGAATYYAGEEAYRYITGEQPVFDDNKLRGVATGAQVLAATGAATMAASAVNGSLAKMAVGGAAFTAANLYGAHLKNTYIPSESMLQEQQQQQMHARMAAAHSAGRY